MEEKATLAIQACAKCKELSGKKTAAAKPAPTPALAQEHVAHNTKTLAVTWGAILDRTEKKKKEDPPANMPSLSSLWRRGVLTPNVLKGGSASLLSFLSKLKGEAKLYPSDIDTSDEREELMDLVVLM